MRRVNDNSMPVAQLGSVQKTLLLPLWGRAVEAAKPHPLLVDETAARIIAAIDYDFSTIAHNISRITQLCWIARSLHTDRAIRGFLERHPAATFVNLGCGLDTTFDRVDNGRLRWYDLDLPDVIELRSQYIPACPRREPLACSLVDDEWPRRIEAADSVFFIASGVLYYFEQKQVKAFLARLADHFPGSELLFDACSARGLRAANRKVIKAGGMDDAAVLKWAIERAGEIALWDRRIDVVSEYPMFRDMRRSLSVKEKWGTLLCDRLRIMSMIHLRFDAHTAAREH